MVSPGADVNAEIDAIGSVSPAAVVAKRAKVWDVPGARSVTTADVDVGAPSGDVDTFARVAGRHVTLGAAKYECRHIGGTAPTQFDAGGVDSVHDQEQWSRLGVDAERTTSICSPGKPASVTSVGPKSRIE